MKDSLLIAGKIDHTLLRSDASMEEIKQLSTDAIHYKFHSICVNPIWLTYVNDIIKGSGVNLCTVIGFPLGASFTSNKLFELDKSIEHGASEIDMVMNIGFFKDKKYNIISEEIKKIVQSANGRIIKVIIETGLLVKEEIEIASRIIEESGANFIKTSTGFSNFGSSTEIIKIIKSSISSNMQIKASGGISTSKQVLNLLEVGADRIGSSASVIIMKELLDN